MLVRLLAAITYEPVQRWGPVSPHGVGTAGGFALGAWIMARNAEPRGIPRQETYNAVTWGAVGAIVGARGFYVLAHREQFDSLRDVLAVWEGGLTMFGGFVGGLALGLWYLYRRDYSIPLALDAAAPGFVAGVVVGRVGDLLIGDHLGTRTDFFLGYEIPRGVELAPGYGPPTYVPGAVVHHTALYDLLGALLLAGALALLARRRPATGTLFAAFCVWYGIQRFAIDFTRNREIIESFFFGLSGSQWAGLAFTAFGAAWLLRIHSRAPVPAPADEAPAAPPDAVERDVPPPPDTSGPWPAPEAVAEEEPRPPGAPSVTPSEEQAAPPPNQDALWGSERPQAPGSERDA